MRSLYRLPGVVALSGLALVLVAGGPAVAHPTGAHQTIELTADGTTVRAAWQAPEDDLIALALHLQVLDGPQTYVFQDGVLVPEESDASIVDTLAASPELASYLLKHVRVAVGESACPGVVEPIADLVADGATVTFTCPAAVATASVTADPLTDLHPDYRTAVTHGNRTVNYTVERPVFDWDLGEPGATPESAAPAAPAAPPAAPSAAVAGGSASDTGRPAAPVAAGVAAGIAALALVALVAARIRRRRGTSTPGAPAPGSAPPTAHRTERHTHGAQSQR